MPRRYLSCKQAIVKPVYTSPNANDVALKPTAQHRVMAKCNSEALMQTEIGYKHVRAKTAYKRIIAQPENARLNSANLSLPVGNGSKRESSYVWVILYKRLILGHLGTRQMYPS
jgi:hypothetical protein